MRIYVNWDNHNIISVQEMNTMIIETQDSCPYSFEEWLDDVSGYSPSDLYNADNDRKTELHDEYSQWAVEWAASECEEQGWEPLDIDIEN